MPQAVAKVEQMGAVILRQRLAVLAEVGDVVEAGCQPVVFLLGHGAAARMFALAEIQCKRQLLLVGDVLVVKQQHGIFVHAGFDVGRLMRRAVVPLDLPKKLLPDGAKSTFWLHARYAFRAIRPPSTGITAPVRNEAAGRHRLSVMWRSEERRVG